MTKRQKKKKNRKEELSLEGTKGFLFLFSRALAAPVLLALLDAVLLAKVLGALLLKEELGLDGGGVDAKAVEDLLDLLAGVAEVAVGVHGDVDAGDDHAVDEVPDVEVVDAQDSLDLLDLVLQLGEADLRRGALQQDATALLDCKQ